MDEKERQCVDDCMNQDMEKHQLKYLLYLMVVTFTSTAVALWLSPYYFASVQDPEGLYRFILISIPKALMGMTVLIGSSVAIDFLIAGDLLKRIAENSIASSIYAGLLMVAMSMAM
jgi:hypothetical protein